MHGSNTVPTLLNSISGSARRPDRRTILSGSGATLIGAADSTKLWAGFAVPGEPRLHAPLLVPVMVVSPHQNVHRHSCSDEELVAQEAAKC